MLFTLNPATQAVAESILRQELIAELGGFGWAITVTGDDVEFSCTEPESYQPVICFGEYGTFEARAAAIIHAHFDGEKARTNARINALILAIEDANPITHRTKREFMIGVQTMLAGLLNITPEQLLDPQSPHYSHAYAKFVSVNNETITKRQERVP